MKVHLLKLYIVDFDEVGADGAKQTIENQRFLNDCIAPYVIDVKTADAGEWDDSHPLNSSKTAAAELARLFGSA